MTNSTYWNGGRAIRGNGRFVLVLQLQYIRFLQCQLSLKEYSVGTSHDSHSNGRLIIRCKLSITDLRNKLETDSVEAIECLHSWFGNGLIKNILTLTKMRSSSE